MSFKFNPFTDKLDIVGPSGGGVVVETLSDDVGTVVNPTANNIQLVGHVVEQGATKFSTVVAGTSLLNINPMSSSRWIVDPLGFNGTHTTIASALTSATSGDTIFLLPGTYTENPTLKAGVNIAAYECGAESRSVVINGKCTGTFAGSCAISGVCFRTNGDFALSVTGSSATTIFLNNCVFDQIANTAISITSSGGALVTVTGCMNFDSGNNNFFALSNTCALRIYTSVISNGSSSTGSTLANAAAVEIHNSDFRNPISSADTSSVAITNCNMLMGGNQLALTCNNTSGNNLFFNNYIASGTSSCISIGTGAALIVSNVTLKSSNTNVITGAGTLQYGMIVFSGSSSGHNVTTETALNTLI